MEDFCQKFTILPRKLEWRIAYSCYKDCNFWSVSSNFPPLFQQVLFVSKCWNRMLCKELFCIVWLCVYGYIKPTSYVFDTSIKASECISFLPKEFSIGVTVLLNAKSFFSGNIQLMEMLTIERYSFDDNIYAIFTYRRFLLFIHKFLYPSFDIYIRLLDL